MADPLSLATRGKFTSSSYKNMMPVTIATIGRILVGIPEELEDDVTYGRKRFYSYDDQWRAELARKEKERQITEVEDTQVEYQEPAEIIQAPPLALNIKPISEITEDQELIRELRIRAILEHAERERKLELERQETLRKYKKRMRVMIALLLEED